MSRATLGSRLTRLSLLAETGQLGALRSGIEALRADGLRSWAIDYLEIETLRLQGEHQRAFRISVEEEDPLCWGELAAETARAPTSGSYAVTGACQACAALAEDMAGAIS